MFACNAQMYIHPFLGQKEMKIKNKRKCCLYNGAADVPRL